MSAPNDLYRNAIVRVNVDVVRAATRVLVQGAVTGMAVIRAVRDELRGNGLGRPCASQQPHQYGRPVAVAADGSRDHPQEQGIP